MLKVIWSCSLNQSHFDHNFQDHHSHSEGSLHFAWCCCYSLSEKDEEENIENDEDFQPKSYQIIKQEPSDTPRLRILP
jgi:hypothetical protein